MSTITLQRSFIIGDEWCYFKIYTGFKVADTLLLNSLYPLAKSLTANQIIDKWFFIRYADPKFHLRIRFHADSLQKISAVIMNFNHAVKPYIENGQVWKVQADTYNREMERYGVDTMELSESLFCCNSEMVCKIIGLEKVKTDENLRWLLTLKAMDSLLDDFGFGLQEKWDLLNTLQDNFGKEFGLNNDYRRQFGQKYRTLKPQIEKILDKKTEQEEEFIPLFQPVMGESEQRKTIVRAIKEKINSNEQLSLQALLQSYIHMLNNRMFRTQQRTHELILYDYLFRYYNALQARQGGKVLETRKKIVTIK